MTPRPKTNYLVQHIYLDGFIIHHTQLNLYQTISDQIDKKKTISDQIYKKKTPFEVLCLIWSDIRPGLPLSDLVGHTERAWEGPSGPNWRPFRPPPLHKIVF